MRISTNKQESERFLSYYFQQKLDEDVKVEILAEEPVREVQAVTYTSLMVQQLWMEFMEPTNNEPNFAPVKIRLIKLYMGLYHKLTGRKCGLVEAKKFIEIHQTHY